MKFFSRALLACVCLAATAFAQTVETAPVSAPSTRPGPKPGELAPDFTVIGPKGEEIKLSDFRGKLVLIDIWATWCGPCIASMPHNSEIAEKFANDLVILAVNAHDSRANYDGWVARNGDKYKFLTAFDPAGQSNWANSVFNTQYGVTGFPSLFLVDREGRLVGSTAGGGSGENPHVTRLLAKGGLAIDTSHLPPEDLSRPSSIPAVAKRPANATNAANNSPVLKFGQVAAEQPAPDFTVESPDGKPVKLSDYKGRSVFVGFWSGARNPPADLTAIAADYRAQGLEVLAINVATEKADFAKWYAENSANLTYAVAWDPAGKAFNESAAYMQYGVGMFPAYFMVKPDGTLVGGIIGLGEKVSGHLREILLRGGMKPTEADFELIRKTIVPEHLRNGGMQAAQRRPQANAAAAPTGPLGTGAIAPDFVMHDVDGRTVKLSDFKNKVVILDFWATWCGPCISSFPHTQAIAAKYKDQDVVVLASGTSDTIAQFKQWIPKNQPKYPDMIFVFDPNERGSATFEERASSKLYRVSGIPTQFIIGRDGKIIETIVGNGGKEDARTEAALAKAGVKVDPAVVAKGNEQLAAAAERAAKDAAAAAEAAKNPPPPFRENFGTLAAGTAPAAFDVEDAAGDLVPFSSIAPGKALVLAIWSAGMGGPEPMVQLWESWNKKYADKGVVFAAICGFDSREAFDQWRAKTADQISFPVYFDPAGKPPVPPKPRDEMTEEEQRAYGTASREHMGKVVPMKLGGIITPIPALIVFNSEGNLLGWAAGYGPRSAEAVGNLLLRAGIELAAEDRPSRVYTAEETKPAAPAPRVETLKIGALAPDFTTTTLDGKPVKLSDFKGKVVILDFWATWCGPCMVAMPHTQEVAAQYKDQGVVVLGSCTSDTRDKFESWVKANQSKYPDILWSHDPAERGNDRASYKLYGVSGIPTQFIIDREGRIVDIVIGYKKGEVILDASLAKAGVKVDAAILEKARADLASRAALSGQPPSPALPLTPKR